jgi:pyridoxine kinase
MNVITIESGVAWGHVGNAAAVFCLQRLGIEAWPIDTVTFSNHPGHGGFRGRVTPAGEIEDLVRGIAERGWLGQTDAVLTGYLGDPAQGAAVRAAVGAIKSANPGALWLLDPVMGDRKPGQEGRIFVKPGIPEFLAQVAPLADILTPNAFEFARLTGAAPDSLEAPGALEAIVAAARAYGPEVVVVKSLEFTPGTLTAVAVAPDGAWAVDTPLLPTPGNGAGDAFAALFLARYLDNRDVEAALGLAVSSIHAVLAATVASGAAELALVAAQDQLVAPAKSFRTRRVG